MSERRLIEEYLPVTAVSYEATREIRREERETHGSAQRARSAGDEHHPAVELVHARAASRRAARARRRVESRMGSEESASATRIGISVQQSAAASQPFFGPEEGAREALALVERK